jgi:hypothetical protein
VASVLTAQLAEQVDGDDRRSAAVHLHDDGCVHVNGVDSGAKVRNFWDSDNYEYWVRVPEGELGKLAFHLLRQHYAGNPNAVAEFRAFCEANDIKHGFESWF